LVADFAVRERFTGLDIPNAQQQIEEIAMDLRSRRGLASRDDLINRCAPILLKARPFSIRKGEGVFAPRKPDYQGRPSGSFDIVADHIAQLLAAGKATHATPPPEPYPERLSRGLIATTIQLIAASEGPRRENVATTVQ
jgi:hypothetical protein